MMKQIKAKNCKIFLNDLLEAAKFFLAASFLRKPGYQPPA
ncbi:hypothetical protein FHS68_000819 [Dyadobacter arcticus]|uniref:Uncharacterized protein n=1 Tax=Dyadobacter arcticus TaxID=1078754 RepID=A0ABX0UF76_9BACT|nr:hypothetical protein [Dyadobacter arcticus]